MSPSVFELIAALLVLTAAFGWVNHRYVGLPNTIGILLMGLLSSLLLIGIEIAVPHITLYESLLELIRRVDFQSTVLDGMLAFLLFAGALHVDLTLLQRRAGVVALMATVGVLISTFLVGFGLWAAASVLGIALPLAWALVFGALISPTDPVAVLSTLKAVKVPDELQIDMTGESLFNDGVGVVVFSVMLAIALGSESGSIDLWQIAELFAVEAFGGAALGLVAGYIAYRAMRAIDDFPVEVMISLALATGAYALASELHLSGPIAVVVAGLLIGNRGPKDALSDETQRYLFGSWTVIDEILNSVLFLLIGLEVLVVRLNPELGMLAAAAIPLTLGARFVSVALPVLALRRWRPFTPGTIPVLTWGGLRGGISVALALSVPEVAEKSQLLAATYTVVVFTIIVQGLSLQRLVRKVVRT